MKKIRLTKKRLAALDAALSIDDILYAKFQHMMRYVNEREERFRARRQIREVLRRDEYRGMLCDYQMQILEVHDTGRGLVIIVR